MQHVVRAGSLRKKSHQTLKEDEFVWQHSDEEFQQGVRYKARMIGTDEINKPVSKNDIITAMRRTRASFRRNGIKKTRVWISISTNGVSMIKRPNKRNLSNYFRPQQYEIWTEEEDVLNHIPIHKIFYVSHDSRDKKIFSYIYRDVDNTFKCTVFKGRKKRHSLRCVRTIGQAFEVCHKLNPPPKPSTDVAEGTDTTVNLDQTEEQTSTTTNEASNTTDGVPEALDQSQEQLLVDITDTSHGIPTIPGPTTRYQQAKVDPWRPVEAHQADLLRGPQQTQVYMKMKPNPRPLVEHNPFAEGQTDTNPFVDDMTSPTPDDMIDLAAEEIGLSSHSAQVIHLKTRLESLMIEHKTEFDRRVSAESLLKQILEQKKESSLKIIQLENQVKELKQQLLDTSQQPLISINHTP